MQTRELIAHTYDAVTPSIPLEEWHSEVITTAELVINGCLMKLPWFKAQRNHIEQSLGGYRTLFIDTVTYVLAHTPNNPDHPSATLEAVAKAMAQDLREFDNSPYTTAIEGIEVVASPLLNNPEGSLFERAIIGLAPDDRGREILLDVAAGTSLRAAADNNGITPQSAHARMKRLQLEAKEALDVV